MRPYKIRKAKNSSKKEHVFYILVQFGYLIDSLITILSLGFLTSGFGPHLLFLDPDWLEDSFKRPN